MPDLSAFSALRHLELSYNAVHSLAPLKACGATRLEELYAASNKIGEVLCASGVQLLRASSHPIVRTIRSNRTTCCVTCLSRE